jgi:hypothetical protein
VQFYTYSSFFFQTAGFNDPFAVTCITNAIQLVVILVVVASVEKLGRRNICCSGLTIMVVCDALIGIVGVVESTKATQGLLVFFSCVYSALQVLLITSFCTFRTVITSRNHADPPVVGLQFCGSTGWGYVGEISSQRLRSYTAGFAAALSCVMGVIMNVLVPYMLSPTAWNWNLKTAFFYLGIGAPFVIGAWFIIPETSG